MSGTTKTPNYNLLKPNVGADNDLWGDHLNTNSDTLDALIKTVENKAGVVSFNGRNNVVSLTNADVVTVLPASNAAPLINGTATAGLATTWSKGDHVHPTDTTRAAASSVPSPSAVAPTMNSVADAGVAVAYSRGDHTHPSDTSRYAASNPSGYQTAAQVTTALLPYAPLASPALTGSPTAPTVTPSTDSSTKIASTAFVQSALGAVPGGAVIAATAPAGLNPGALWWDSTGGQLYVRYDDGNTQQFVVATNVSGGASAGDVAMAQNNVGRNKLHNGLFTVAQRGAAFTVTGAQTAYSADRWVVQSGAAGDTAGLNINASADADRTAVGDEAFTSMASLTFVGTAAAGSMSRVSQKIEGVRRLSGKTVIVSFWAATSALNKIGISIDQYFGTGGSPSASVTGSGIAVTTTTTAWTRYSVTLVIPSATGKTVGTNGDSCSILNIWGSAGSTLAAASGGIGNQGTWYANIWGVQLEIAAPGQTQPSPLEKLDPRMELSNCQRFFCTGACGVSAYATAGMYIASFCYFQPMRAIPTITIGSAIGGDLNLGAAGSPDAITTQSFRMAFGATATGQIAASRNFTASADL